MNTQYALLIHQHGQFKCEVSVPSAADAGKVLQHTLERVPEGLNVRVYPVPHMPPDTALPIDAMPFGAINTINNTLRV